MKVIYVAGDGLIGAAIRAVEGGRWSHVGIIDGDHVIEAVWSEGVRIRKLSSLIADRPIHEILEVPLPDEEKAILWARSQIGKPYDFGGVLGLGFNRNWSDDRRWYCSELAGGAALQGGRTPPAEEHRLGVKKGYIWLGGTNP